MTYLPNLHSYLHHSSLLLQAYPSSRVTTKYSLPRKPNKHSLSKQKDSSNPQHQNGTDTDTAVPQPESTTTTTTTTRREKREPSATLTLKTYHPETGICLKYRTDKAAEVGRLMAGLGRLARGEVVPMPSEEEMNGKAEQRLLDAGEAMDVDSGADVKGRSTPVSGQEAGKGVNGSGGGAGGKKKKKGKK